MKISSDPPRAASDANFDLIVPATLLTVAVIFGGGGSPSPFSELIVQLAALGALSIWINLSNTSAGGQDRFLWAGLALLVAIPLVQLVPLPPLLWHVLPGREVKRQALALINLEETWQPVSISPYRTVAAALSMIPPLTMTLFVSRLSQPQRCALLGFLATLGAGAAVIGMLQVIAGESGALTFYGPNPMAFALGFQANRNQSVDVLLIAMLALTAFAETRTGLNAHWTGRMIVGVGLLFFGLTSLLTGSRAGTALLVIVAVRTLFFFAQARGKLQWAQLAAGGLGLTLLATALVAGGNVSLSRTWARFNASGDARFSELWPDTVFAVSQYWPVGAGMGTFVPAFERAERLEVVDLTSPNRAHNDYLEFTLEAGIAAVACLIMLAVGTARAIIRHLSSRSAYNRSQARFVLGGG